MAAVSTQDTKINLQLEELGKELLPGMPNEVTLDQITTKLSWRVLSVLSCVNRTWHEAIRTEMVYDARVRANSTEMLIAHCDGDEREVVALYSTREKRCHELPPIPWVPIGTLRTCKLILLRGKLYVLRGRLRPTCQNPLELDFVSPEMYMLDLAGRREWKQCASMREARSRYGCGVMYGKIYVFGGITLDIDGLKPVLGAEVYDPEENTWSPLMQMTQGRFGHDSFGYNVATVGKELLLCDEQRWLDRVHGENAYKTWLDSTVGKKEMPLAVYNPAKNAWRLVKLFGDTRKSSGSKMFVAKYKFFLFSHSGIDAYDVDQKSWTNLHANSFPPDGPTDSAPISPLKVLAVNDELVVVGWWTVGGGRCLCRSFHCTGFESEKKEMLWQKINCSNMCFDVSPIQL